MSDRRSTSKYRQIYSADRLAATSLPRLLLDAVAGAGCSFYLWRAIKYRYFIGEFVWGLAVLFLLTTFVPTVVIKVHRWRRGSSD